jgi:hypothetical protein
MLSVTNKPFMLSVIMLNVIMLNVVSPVSQNIKIIFLKLCRYTFEQKARVFSPNKNF